MSFNQVSVNPYIPLFLKILDYGFHLKFFQHSLALNMEKLQLVAVVAEYIRDTFIVCESTRIQFNIITVYQMLSTYISTLFRFSRFKISSFHPVSNFCCGSTFINIKDDTRLIHNNDRIRQRRGKFRSCKKNTDQK